MNTKLNILALSIVLTLSGCSKKQDYSEESVADSAATEAVAASADAVATDSVSVERESTIQEVQNPTQILANQQSQLEQSRKLVKTSQLSFWVGDIQKSVLAIEKQLLEVNGYIEEKHVDYQNEGVETRNKLDGTIDVFEKIKPVAILTVRVPNAEVSTFLNGLIPLIKDFNHQNYEAKRYDLKLLEEKMRTANDAYGASNAVKNQLQALTEREVQDRLNYSTISLQIYQDAQLRRSTDINLNRIANIHSDPFLHRVWESIKMGFIALREVIVWLLMFWPLFIIGGIAFWVYRKFFYKKNTLSE